jgi:hypothetical protein
MYTLKDIAKRCRLLKGCYHFLRNRFHRLYFLLSRQNKKLKKLHLGCGRIHLDGYINIDVSSNSAADMVLDIQHIDKYFKKDSIAEILIIHAISYLRLHDARRLVGACFNILESGGKLIVEFPDVVKCSKIIINNISINDTKDLFQYIEGIRGFYAFDLKQIERQVRFNPYAFGWSANHMKYELMDLGFKSVFVFDGIAHERPERDTRIEAAK